MLNTPLVILEDTQNKEAPIPFKTFTNSLTGAAETKMGKQEKYLTQLIFPKL